jgi:hypothetical protein
MYRSSVQVHEYNLYGQLRCSFSPLSGELYDHGNLFMTLHDLCMTLEFYTVEVEKPVRSGRETSAGYKRCYPGQRCNVQGCTLSLIYLL